MKKLFSIALIFLACSQPATHALSPETSVLAALFLGSAAVQAILKNANTPSENQLIENARRDLSLYQDNWKKSLEILSHALQNGGQESAESHLNELGKHFGKTFSLKNAHLLLSNTIETFDKHIKKISKRLSLQFDNSYRDSSVIEKLEAVLHDIQQERVDAAKMKNGFEQIGIAYERYEVDQPTNFSEIFTFFSGVALFGFLLKDYVTFINDPLFRHGTIEGHEQFYFNETKPYREPYLGFRN